MINDNIASALYQKISIKNCITNYNNEKIQNKSQLLYSCTNKITINIMLK